MIAAQWTHRVTQKPPRSLGIYLGRHRRVLFLRLSGEKKGGSKRAFLLLNRSHFNFSCWEESGLKLPFVIEMIPRPTTYC